MSHPFTAHRPTRLLATAALFTLLLGAVGCDQAEIHAYAAPKDPPPGKLKEGGDSGKVAKTPGNGAATRKGQPDGGDRGFPDAAEVTWDLPKGWQQRPPSSRMRYATLLAGSGDDQVQFSVTRFPGDVGGALANVNRWRGQIGLGDIDRDGFIAKVQAGEELKMIRISGIPSLLMDTTGPKGRLLAASIPAPDQRTWFFKAIGPAVVLGKHKAAFEKMLGTVKFNVKAAPPAQDDERMVPPTEPLSSYVWTAPKGWKTNPKRPMLQASYSTGEGNDQVTLTLSALPGNGGGLLPNINRWRAQLGLKPHGDNPAELQQYLNPDALTNVADARGLVIEIDGAATPPAVARKMVVALAPRAREIWFIKMTGPAPLVEKNRAAFDSFLVGIKKKGADSPLPKPAKPGGNDKASEPAKKPIEPQGPPAPPEAEKKGEAKESGDE